jgi:hypothetical protein
VTRPDFSTTRPGCYDGTLAAPIKLEGAAKTFAVTADKTGIDFGVAP